jgi:hypothetical protein
MPRFLLFLLSLAFAPALAFAHDGDRQLCDGKYALAQEMLDAAYGKYGTIYSGGYDGYYEGNGVGPTIDLWRLWRGLPDLRFRNANTFDWWGTEWGVVDLGGFGNRPEDFAMLLRIADRSRATGLEENYRYITALFLNSLVDPGSGPGWWLAPTPRDATHRQTLVIDAATPGSLMEWLLVMQADSDMPDSVAWVRSAKWAAQAGQGAGVWITSTRYPWGMDTPAKLLRELVGTRARTEPGLQWQAAVLVTEGGRFDGLNIPILGFDCDATPAEYALAAVAFYEGLKRDGVHADLHVLHYLPQQMRQNAMANLSMLAVHQTGRSRDTVSATKTLREVAALSTSPGFSSWLFAGHTWTAGTVEELVSFHEGTRLDGHATDTLNMLSLDDLATFADQVTLPDDQRRGLLTVIAGRAFVLGRLDVARHYLSELKALMPEDAILIQDALDGPGGKGVQIANALLALPAQTVWLPDGVYAVFDRSSESHKTCCFRNIDLPLRFTSAAVLNRDLRRWLKAPPAPWRWSILRRAAERGRVHDDSQERPFVPDDWQKDEGFPFLRLIAWDELARLDVCRGLTSRLGEVLIDWVDKSSDTWLERTLADDSAFPDTLRRIIILNRHSPGALVNGKPAGQRAFALLSTRFAGTEAAKATPYWYFEDEGCRE